MLQYHRAFIEGGTYFFTVITYNRMPILTTNEGREVLRSASRWKLGEAALWQRRFWEHAIRDEEDYHRHLDYIHTNPVKHGWVERVSDWPWSSFHRYVRLGWYEPAWGEEARQEGLDVDCGE